MGYVIDRTESEGLSFPIGTQQERERFLEFAKALMKAIVEERRECVKRFPWDGAVDEVKKYEDCYSELWDNVRSWEDTLDCFRRFLKDVWDSPFEINEWHDRLYVEFDFDGGGKWHGDTEEFFLKALAPYMSAGSFIGFEGEDNDLWSYVFDGKGGMRIHKPTIDWTGEKTTA